MARSKRELRSRVHSQIRCAIYTRKSSEEGLEQSFNSLDAQREACESYVASQVGEGWTALPDRYDDGGFSGGSMERPGLKRLLADIALRKVDVVVVYKVDRLTRSLADFARIVDTFDTSGVSFVSVTQAFNTTTSMGRLTLNVLLSFAQFEREVTGERIRDKIAASKKKGMWMGGSPPLGYRPHERTLLIHEEEAATVRHIFRRYLELRSVHELRRDLDRDGIRARPSRKTAEPTPFGRGSLYHLLSNRIYVGQIVHRDEIYPGQHEPIMDREIFDEAQLLLASNRSARKEGQVTGRAPLAGLIFDRSGQPLSPTTARRRGGKLYRYYVSADLQRGRSTTGLRLSAPGLEQAVLDHVERECRVEGWQAARARLGRVEVTDTEIVVSVNSSIDEAPARIPFIQRRWRGRSKAVVAPGLQSKAPSIDPSLLKAITRAHALVRKLRSDLETTIEAIAADEDITPAYVRRLVRLAYLSPDIQEAVLHGRLPASVSLEKLMRHRLPIAWSRQRKQLGIM